MVSFSIIAVSSSMHLSIKLYGSIKACILASKCMFTMYIYYVHQFAILTFVQSFIPPCLPFINSLIHSFLPSFLPSFFSIFLCIHVPSTVSNPFDRPGIDLSSLESIRWSIFGWISWSEFVFIYNIHTYLYTYVYIYMYILYIYLCIYLYIHISLNSA